MANIFQFPRDPDQDIFIGILHPAGQAVFCRNPVDKGTESDSLDKSRDGDLEWFDDLELLDDWVTEWLSDCVIEWAKLVEIFL